MDDEIDPPMRAGHVPAVGSYEHYARFINTGRYPDESDTWQAGDLLEFDDPGLSLRVRFVQLDQEDPIGFLAAEVRDGSLTNEPASAGWTRGRFRKIR